MEPYRLEEGREVKMTNRLLGGMRVATAAEAAASRRRALCDAAAQAA
jgi:hypothetical protein